MLTKDSDMQRLPLRSKLTTIRRQTASGVCRVSHSSFYAESIVIFSVMHVDVNACYIVLFDWCVPTRDTMTLRLRPEDGSSSSSSSQWVSSGHWTSRRRGVMLETSVLSTACEQASRCPWRHPVECREPETMALVICDVRLSHMVGLRRRATRYPATSRYLARQLANRSNHWLVSKQVRSPYHASTLVPSRRPPAAASLDNYLSRWQCKTARIYFCSKYHVSCSFLSCASLSKARSACTELQ